MKCMKCGTIDSKVIDSRPSDDGSVTRRRRECIACGMRFTTYEKIEQKPVFVIKRDGRREPFIPEKIQNGLIRACEKRPISLEKINSVVQEIEKEINNSLKLEVDSSEIGEMLITRLKKLDEVAYVRFASVYKSFQDINTFMEELNRMVRENEGK